MKVVIINANSNFDKLIPDIQIIETQNKCRVETVEEKQAKHDM